MKTKNPTMFRPIRGFACAAAALFAVSTALGQNLFVSGYDSGDIYEYMPNGSESTFASGMDYPTAMAISSAGDIFVGNSANNASGSGSITEFTPGGSKSTFASGIDPQGLAFNSAGDLFESDYNSGNIYEFTPGGVRSTFATGFSFPLAMIFNSSGDLFVGNGYGDGSGAITEISPNGTESTLATGLNFPNGLAFNGAGDLFVSSADGGTIYQYTPGGVQSTFATVDSGGLEGLAFDSAGNLFVANPGNSIIEITPGGVQSTFAKGSVLFDQLAFQPVPEPSVYALLGIGAVGLLVFWRRSRRSFCSL